LNVKPQSLAIPTDPKGRLPLHLAFIHGKSCIIPFLLEHNPDAVRQCDNQIRLPIHYALKITTEMLTTTCKIMDGILSILQLFVICPLISFSTWQKNHP